MAAKWQDLPKRTCELLHSYKGATLAPVPTGPSHFAKKEAMPTVEYLPLVLLVVTVCFGHLMEQRLAKKIKTRN